VRGPRVRADGQGVATPRFKAMADVDPFNRCVIEQMLVGVATRRYARSLGPVPATMRSRGTSKSVMRRRLVAKTTAQVAAWQTASLETLDLVGLLIDGVHIGERCLIVALGIAADGQKHALGLWDGSGENARVCQDLLAKHSLRTWSAGFTGAPDGTSDTNLPYKL
jgi:transposase-like protein